VRQFHIALVGALMVAALALLLDAAMAFAVWASVPGTGRLRRTPPTDSNVTKYASKSPGLSPTVDA
jgi:osmoprotectant transport system permease protein